MTQNLAQLKTTLKSLPVAELQTLLTEITTASGQGAVAIARDANGAMIVTGSDNIVGDNNSVVIHQGADTETLKQIFREVLELQTQTLPTMLTGVDGLGLLSDVPELPPNFLPRPDDLAPLKEKVLEKANQAVAVIGKANKIGIQGMGGIGKSVLATALAHDVDIQQAFPNGIMWVRLGNENVDVIGEQTKVARALTNDPQNFANSQDGKVFLENLLRDVTCLLILDDVWHREQVKAFEVLGPRCKMVMTSRDAGIVESFGAELRQLDVLSDAQALQLLADASEQNVATLPATAKQVVVECGNLPLALAMVGALAQGDPDLWNDLLEALQNADLEEIEENVEGTFPHPDLLKAMKVSVDALELAEQERYLDFAIFPEDTPIPTAALKTFWQACGVNKLKQKRLIDRFVKRSLIRQDETQRLTLHDLQLDYVRKQVGDNLPERHKALLAAYEAQCLEGWHTGPQDGYFFRWLPYHLLHAGKANELQDLLLNYFWLQAKLNATSIHFLITDYDLPANCSDANLVQDALQLSVAALSEDKTQLKGQLLGRLMKFKRPAIQALLKQATCNDCPTWLRPLNCNLTTPGGTLKQILRGHSLGVTCVTVTKDGQKIVSGSRDGSLKVWNFHNGLEFLDLQIHSGRIYSAATTSDNQKGISASEDCTIKIWDLNNGQLLHTLTGHTSPVRSIALIETHKLQVISASEDGTLKLWSAENGQELISFSGHSGEVYSVVVNGNRAISASEDCTLKVWDLEVGKELFTLKGHEKAIRSVASTEDGKYAVSASEDTTLRIWNLATGQQIHVLKGHKGEVWNVVIAKDGQKIISASRDWTVKVWDLATGRLFGNLGSHSGWVWSVAVLSDSQQVISASEDRTLKIWGLNNSLEESPYKGNEDAIRDLAITPDGTRIIAASANKTLKVLDLSSGHEIQTLEGHDNWVGCLASKIDSKQIISGSDDRSIKIWDLETGSLVRDFAKCSKVPIRALALKSNDKQTIFPSDKGHLRILDLVRNQEISEFSIHQDWIQDIVLSPDEKWIATASSDCSIKITDISEIPGQVTQVLEGHKGWVMAIILINQGKSLISASADKTIRIWDLETGYEQQQLLGHKGWVLDVATTKNEEILISASNDCTLKVWDLKSGKVIASFNGDHRFYTCSITSEGNTIVAGDAIGKIHFFNLAM